MHHAPPLPSSPSFERHVYFARACAHRTNVHLHTLADAGHWVHVDDLDGMLRLMGPTFAPPEPC